MRIISNELEFVRNNIDDAEAEAFVDILSKSSRIFCFALGRAGFAVKSFAMRLMHMGNEVYVLTETITPNFAPDNLFIIASGSGETAQLIALAKKAKSLGGTVAVLTSNRNSTITQHADVVLQISAPAKNQQESEFRSQQPMASLFEQALLVVGDAVVMELAKMSRAPETELFKRHVNLE